MQLTTECSAELRSRAKEILVMVSRVELACVRLLHQFGETNVFASEIHLRYVAAGLAQ